MNKPKAFKKGDKVAIVSLSKGILGEPFAAHQIELGKKRLAEFGLEAVFMPNSLKGIEYLENNPEARASDLKQAFMDDEIKGIICAIGGEDTYKTLPFLLDDNEFIEAVKKSPKLFTGYSDTTVNHLMFNKLGLVTFYGPNFLVDMAELDNEMLPYTKKYFMEYFTNENNKTVVSSDIWYDERTDFSSKSLGISRVSHKEERGYEVLQGSGKFSGKLLGGCLETIHDVLTATRYDNDICSKYEIFPAVDEWRGKILFLETSESQNSKEFVANVLNEIKNTGILDVISGIIVGKPQNEAHYEGYKDVYRNLCDNKNFPILYNINFGHAHPKCVFPYGIETEVDMDNKKITFLEKWFQE